MGVGFVWAVNLNLCVAMLSSVMVHFVGIVWIFISFCYSPVFGELVLQSENDC